MSGGFETVFATAIAGIGFLASPGGQDYQSQMYDDILNVYQTPEEAFTRAVSEEKSEFVAAFVREVLRFYPPLHFLPPRQTFKDFEYHGSTIPKGLMVFMNAQAINHGVYAVRAGPIRLANSFKILQLMVQTPTSSDHRDGLKTPLDPKCRPRITFHSAPVLGRALPSTFPIEYCTRYS